jgi:hypothetical protein
VHTFVIARSTECDAATQAASPLAQLTGSTRSWVAALRFTSLAMTRYAMTPTMKHSRLRSYAMDSRLRGNDELVEYGDVVR